MNGLLLVCIALSLWIMAVSTLWCAVNLAKINSRAEYEKEMERRRARRRISVFNE